LGTADPVRATDPNRSLLQLQRRYGNRCVERIIVARQAVGSTEVTDDMEQSIRRSLGRGQPLDVDTRTRLEPSMGADFGAVRVHANAHADALSRSLNARAFTVGRDIFFRQGAYAPGGSSGRALLAHELAHVVQHGGASVHRALTVSQPHDVHEQEADRVADQVSRAIEAGSIQRQLEEEEQEPRHSSPTAELAPMAEDEEEGEP